MPRQILEENRIHPAIREFVASNHADIVREVQQTLAHADNQVVVVGMAQNPFPKRACRALAAKGIAHRYLEYGNYLSGWRRRNALKMWTGWPTFPMVFVDGTLLGGFAELRKMLDSGELEKLLAQPRSNG